MKTTKSARATREDVARYAGTSTSVVSYVVNCGPRPVAEATRRRVLEAIDAVGYAPNGIARALASGVSGAYGLIVPDISNPFFAALAHALEEAVAVRGNVLLLGDSAESKSREKELLKMFVDRQIDGVLFIGVDSAPDVGAAIAAGIPTVILDRATPRSGVSSVSVDNVAGAQAATLHLIEHGFDRIGIVCGPSNLLTARDRVAGWELAMAESSLPMRTAWKVQGSFSRIGGLKAGRELFSQAERPQAVFASNEQQAVGLMVAAAEAGVRIPDDLAVIAFDGTETSEYTIPAMSTVVQPLKDIASRAVDLLARKAPSDAVHEVCDFELRTRESCGYH